MTCEELFALILEEVQTSSFPLEQTAPEREPGGILASGRYPGGRDG